MDELQNIRPTLDEIANKFSTDKGTLYPGASRHGYTPFYDTYLTKWRDEPIRMLEVGICMEGTLGGHSVYMWKEYFEKAQIFTFDIVDMSNHDCIVGSDRVHFYRGDQGNREDFKSMYESFGEKPFDFIIEDGSHTTKHQMISLAHLFQYVKSGGYYILEDMSIPGHPVCCIRNDESHEIINSFINTGKFISVHITETEKEYLEQNIEKIVLYTDDQDAYMTAMIYKR